MSLAIARDIVAETKSAYRPPQRVRPSDHVHNKLWLQNPGNAFKGYLQIPKPMRRPMDCANSLDYTGVVFVGPSQTLKTTCMVDALLAYNIEVKKSDALMIHTAEDKSNKYNGPEGRMDRLHRYNRGLGDALRRATLSSRRYREGFRIDFGHPSVSQLSSDTYELVLLTDYDRMPLNVGGEGSGWVLGLGRIKTLNEFGMVVAESSPKGETTNPKAEVHDHEYLPGAGIIDLYHLGTMERLYWPCPECLEYFQARPTYDRSYLWYPDSEDLLEAAQKSRLICPKCGSLVNIHKHRNDMLEESEWVAKGQTINRKGVIEGDPPNTDIASFGMSGYAAALQKPEVVVHQYLKALKVYNETDEENTLMGVVNTQMGSNYAPQRSQATASVNTLEQLAANYEIRTVPPGVRYILGLIDIQADSFECSAIGYGINQEEWLIDRFSVYQSDRLNLSTSKNNKVDPAAFLEDWLLLVSRLIERTYPLAEDPSVQVPVYAVSIDSGGQDGVTQNAYDFYRLVRDTPELKHLVEKILLVKGAKQVKTTRITYPDNRDRGDRKVNAMGDVPVLLINTDHFKDSVANSLKRTLQEFEQNGTVKLGLPPARRINFAIGTPRHAFNEIVAEDRTPTGWKKPSPKVKNEQLDHHVYGRAMNAHMNCDKIPWENPDQIPDFAREITKGEIEAAPVSNLERVKRLARLAASD